MPRLRPSPGGRVNVGAADGVDVTRLRRLLSATVTGRVGTAPGDLALYTSDASNYRRVPLAVVVPRTPEDVLATVAACREVGAPLVPRGAGTSMAGNAVGGVVLDTSRHLNQIIAIDPDRRTATVQPGVVLDDLRRAASAHGLTFGPDPSSASRCTIGGMIGNNACGARSVAWGTTADNVHELDVLLYDGTRLRVGATPPDELARLARTETRAGQLYAGLSELIARHETLIGRRFPPFSRRVSGYALDRLLPEHGFHVARALTGTEGTCATVLEATLGLVPLPAARVLLVLGFPTVYAAADVVPAILPHHPLTVEGINDELVARLPDSARGAGAAALPPGRAWLLVEVGDDEPGRARARADDIARAVRAAGPDMQDVVVTDEDATKELWRIRRDGTGLATRRADGSEAWPGWEDAAVPPERLGAYLRELHALFGRHGRTGVVYGHFGEGCLHVRLDFDLLTTAGIGRFREFVEEASDLVVSHGGSISGEHGDGQARAEMLPRMYGPDGVRAFEEFKALWDPDDRMNPGILVRPYRIDENLRNAPTETTRELLTVFAYPDDAGNFAQATRRCVGVGKCLQSTGGVMCPSYMVTREERHSTRGRAHLLWEMVRGEVVTDGWRSREVRDALDLCLSCKGCKSDCPVNVDMATYKSEFLHHHYRGRLRPAAHYSMGWLPLWARVASLAPTIVNRAGGAPVLSTAAKAVAGVARQRQLPRIAEQSFTRWFSRRSVAGTGGAAVLLWPDTFTTFLQPEVGRAAVEVLEAAGFRVLLPGRSVCCGLTWISTGQLGIARRVLRRSLETIRPLVESGVPMVGLEPSCTAVFRSDLGELLPDHDLSSAAAKQTYTLAELLGDRAPDWAVPELGREALAQVHCHQHAIMGFGPDERLLTRAGVRTRVPDSGCCGLAGNFGFERGHYDVSQAAGERVLLPAVRDAHPETLVVADGFSCRTQIEQGTDRKALHLAQVLQMALRDARE